MLTAIGQGDWLPGKSDTFSLLVGRARQNFLKKSNGIFFKNKINKNKQKTFKPGLRMKC